MPERKPGKAPSAHQMRLSEAHPEGVAGFYRYDEEPDLFEQTLTDIQALWRDPEEAINRMHVANQSRHPWKRRPVEADIRREANKRWRELLKEWGVLTPAERFRLLRERTPDEIAFLQVMGVWDILMREAGLSAEQIATIQPILEQARYISLDRDSTENVTIYPTEAALAHHLTHPDPKPPRRRR